LFLAYLNKRESLFCFTQEMLHWTSHRKALLLLLNSSTHTTGIGYKILTQEYWRGQGATLKWSHDFILAILIQKPLEYYGRHQ
jgi:hypothetical protein